MKSLIMGLTLIIVVLFTLFLLGVNKCTKEIDKEIDAPKEKVGKTYVVGKDTLLVMDYSFFHSTYHMSNGQDVSFSLIDNLQPIK